ncbi:EAL domain-containing protein [Salinisphaera sp. T31B1]|uniref:putative bifunctional diguanylate cyclase/phosphodiesterase n=1 Tax=Salinisphaera sp. T31B1 TaxID=727963 RepID=UPI00333F46A8
MTIPYTAADEAERLDALYRLDLIHGPSDPALDRATTLAARLFDMPISLITLVDRDRQWFKSRVGTTAHGTPRAHSFCLHAIEDNRLLVVPDLTADMRFANNPLVSEPPHIRFYAGAPIRTIDGHIVGTLCVMSDELRPDFGHEQARTLADLAALVSGWLRMRESAGKMDPATGIFTRQRLLERLGTLLRRTRGTGPERLLGVVDVALHRQMHELIQVLGHGHAESFIAECIERLAGALGRDQPLYRVGLFRFAVILDEQPGERTAARLSDLVKTLRKPFESDVGVLLAPDTVMGMARIDPGTDRAGDAVEILRRASVAADDAWEGEWGWACYEPGRDERRQRKIQLLADLATALRATDQLYLVYQPKIATVDNRCIGVEALLRWQHPRLGFIPPAELIEAAEKTALMRSLTDWVLDTALAQSAAWRRRGLALPVAVNLSAYDIADENMVERIAQRLAFHSLAGDSLEVEFTESMLIHDLDAATRQLKQLHAMGVATAIDDFGTGYCNLSYIQKLDASKIKIDRQFVQTLDTDERGQTLTRAIIRLAHDLGHSVVAEGVENLATLELLVEWGCDQAQGYLFSRPIRADALFDWCRAREASAHD